MKHIYTGAQGTGKSTILNIFKERGYNVITEVVRNLSKQGVKINEMGDRDGQERIFNEYKRLFKENSNYISDRGLTDVCAYSYDLAKTNPDIVRLAADQLAEIKKFNKENPDVVYFYFPIEFPVVDDGVRSTDEVFRTHIDQLILAILKECEINYIEVRGSVDERVKIIEKYL